MAVLGPEAYIDPQTYGGVLRDVEAIKGSRLQREGIEARRTGLQQARGTTDLAGAYAQQEEERMFVEAAQIADKLHDSGFSLWKKTGDLGMVNQFAQQAYTESPQLRLLFPQGMPTYDKFLGDTVQMSGIFGEDMEDETGGTVKAGTPGSVTFDTTSGAIRKAVPVSAPAKPTAEKPGAGVKKWKDVISATKTTMDTIAGNYKLPKTTDEFGRTTEGTMGEVTSLIDQIRGIGTPAAIRDADRLEELGYRISQAASQMLLEVDTGDPYAERYRAEGVPGPVAPEQEPGLRERGGRPSLAGQPRIQPEGAAPVEKPPLSREQAMAEARRRGLLK